MIFNYIEILLKGLLLHPRLALFLCILGLIYYLLYIQKITKPLITRESSLDILVQSYYVSNIKNTISLLIAYFSITIGIFFLFRISNIGFNRAIFHLTPHISVFNLILIISWLFLFFLFKRVFYFNILKEMFKLYLYLYSTNRGKSIIEFLFDSYHNSKSNKYLRRFSIFLRDIQPDRELSFIAIMSSNDKDSKISVEMINNIRNILQQKPLCHFLIKWLGKVFSSLNRYWWALRYYLIYFILFLIVFYDLIKEAIYYAYFILPIFMIITLYRNLVCFIGTKDFYALDPIIVGYLYTQQTSLWNLLSNENNIKEYLFNGYRGEHASYFFTEKTPSIEPFFVQIKRFYIVLSICIISWSLLFNTTITNTLLLTLPLLMLFITTEFNQFVILESKKLFKRIIYIFSLVSMILINFWVYLTRHHHAYVREIIWDKGILIKQTFTLEEKRDFFYKYLNYTLDNMTTITEDVKKIIVSKITDEDLLRCLTNDTTIEQIRTFSKNLPLVYLRLEKFYDNEFNKIVVENLSNYPITEIWFDRIAFCIIIVKVLIKFKSMLNI